MAQIVLLRSLNLKVVKEHVTVACQSTESFELLLNYIYSGEFQAFADTSSVVYLFRCYYTRQAQRTGSAKACEQLSRNKTQSALH